MPAATQGHIVKVTKWAPCHFDRSRRIVFHDSGEEGSSIFLSKTEMNHSSVEHDSVRNQVHGEEKPSGSLDG